MATQQLILHATCVAVGANGVLITGPSGSGKSALALQLIAYGAVLVADDRTVVTVSGKQVIASPPPAIAGMIEARGVGLLPVTHRDAVPLRLAVDLAKVESQRLPEPHHMTVLDIVLPCLHKVDAPYFPAAIHAYLNGIRKEIS